MARPSIKQHDASELLAETFGQVRALAQVANDSDKALLPLAERANHFASVWIRCTTEHGRADMKQNARALAEHAREVKTPLGLAFLALGQAYIAFAECEYRACRSLASQAWRVAQAPQSRVDAVLN